MTTFSYPVLAFRQQDEAPIQIAFVAHAEQVLRWAGVPRKSDELLTGFQRFRDNRRINEQIVPFFQNPKNCSPTAIIIALRGETGIGKCQLLRNGVPLTEDEIPAESVVDAKLVIEIDEDALKSDAVFAAAKTFVGNRLQSDGNLTSTDEDEEEENGELAGEESGNEDDISDEELDEEAEVTGETDEIAHLGTTTLIRMKQLLDDSTNWKRHEFKEAVADYVKPGTIIDGQHRITAAAKIGNEGLPFIICGLFNAAWPEQVFQFTVVNLKPKRIPPSVITSIAGLSLTRTEQDLVEHRLKQAGIDVAEVTIMSLVSFDERSPFAERVDLAISGPKDREQKLGYGGMKRISKDWYMAQRNSLTLISKALYSTKSVAKARRKWRLDRYWFDFFSVFWGAIRDHYSPHFWQKSPDNRLFIGAHLWALQEVILGEADGQVADWWKIEDLSLTPEQRAEVLKEKLLKVVLTTLRYFPEEMWSATWKASQDTTPGRAELVSLFKRFIDEGKKTGSWRQWRKDPWFNQS
jgi:hypothetical protein